MTDEELERWLGEDADDPAAKHKVRQALRDARKAEKEAVRLLIEERKRVDVALSIANQPQPVAIRARHKPKVREATACILAADWHVGEVVDPRTVNGRNKYDAATAGHRVHRLFKGADWVVRYLRHGYKVDDILLWLGGDIIAGYIHEELMESSELSPTESILLAQKLVTQGIDFLLEHASPEQLVVVCNYGNHGRTTAKRRISTGARNSYEWLMYHSLAQHYASDPRVTFHIADGAHAYVTLYDKWTIRFTHGDDVRYHGGVGGLSIPLRKAIDAWERHRHADYTVLGHYHQWRDFGDAVVCGSLIGWNAYALSVKARFEPPRQGLFVIDKERGKTISTPIWVDKEAK